MARTAVIGGNDAIVTVVDSTPSSEGGLGTIIGADRLVGSINTSVSVNNEKIPSLGTKKLVTVTGAEDRTFNLTLLPAYDLSKNPKKFMEDQELLDKAIGKGNLTIYLTIYQAGKSDLPDKSKYKLGTVIYNGCTILTVGGGYSGGSSTAQIEVSGSYEESVHEY